MQSALRERLRGRLAAAMAARDWVAIAAVRGALAAIANAEAVPPRPGDLRALSIEASPRGVAAAEVPRRDVPDADVVELIRREIADRESAAAGYAAAGHAERAERLSAEARVLRELIETSSTS